MPVPAHTSPTRISSKLNPPAIASHGSRKHTTPFSLAYSQGIIPARIQHGSVKHKVEWTREITSEEVEGVLVLFYQGIAETQFPLATIAQVGLQELLTREDVHPIIMDNINHITTAIRSSIGSKDDVVFGKALNAVALTADALGEEFIPHLASMLSPMGKKVLEKGGRGPWGDKVMDVLHRIEDTCGEAAGKIIKAKVPTYQNNL